MNYYIHGDAANADKIKAAFERLGCKNTNNFTFGKEDNLYFTFNGKVDWSCYEPFNKIIKTHPDYKELELQVAPKFKVGDLIINRFRDICLITDIDLENGYYICETNHFGNTDGDIDLTDKAFHLWTIEDAKDGDVLATTKVRSCPFIYRKTSYKNNLAYYYAGIDGNGDFCEGCIKRTLFHFGPVENVVPATKEQRDLLFAKMREAGYEWDADKKELKKIKHYDIANFHVGMPVLVRDENNCEWHYTTYSHYSYGYMGYKFRTSAVTGFVQCIPFNDDTKHLLGSTDMPSEKYINW